MPEELSQSRLNQILLDNLPCVALLLRPSSREIVASNQAAVKVGAVPGSQCFATWGQRDAPCPWCLAPKLWQTGEAQHLEVETQGVVWEAHWVPVGPDLYLHYALDITERKRMAEALQDGDKTLNTLLNAIPESIFLVDADRKVVAANETLAQRLGKSLAELIGADIFAVIPAEVAQRRMAYVNQVFRTGQEVRFEDERNGRLFDILLHPILDAEGQVAKLAVLSLDITERRQTEQVQRECEKKYRNLFEESFDGLFITSAAGKILDINKKGVAMFGYDTKEEMLRLDLAKDIYAYPQDRQRIISLINAQGAGEYEVIVKKKNGAKMMARCSLTAERDKKGKIVSYRGIIRDITERKLAEEELAKNHRQLQKTAQRLEQSRNTLRLVIESIPARVFWKDRDSRFMGCNTLFARDAGLSRPEELVGKDDFAMGWREQAELYRADDRQVMKSRRPKKNIVEPQTTPTGAKIWLNTSKVPLQMPNGEVFGVLGVYEDITERKQAEEALRQALETLRATLDAAPVAIFNLDPEGRVKSLWNAAAERMLGWRRDEVLGRLLPSISEDDQEEFSRSLEWIHSGKAIMGKDVVRRRKDGSLIEYSIFAAPEYDADGKVIGNIAVLMDITERKRAEEERLAHLRFFEDMDRVNRAIQGSDDLEQVMSDVLNVVLSIFNCDRAWLLHPCDPEALAWRVPMERTRPEYPGAFALGLEVPMDPEATRICRTVLASDGPVKFGPGSQHPLAAEVAQRFGYQSQISMALYPKGDKPYMFGLHQCSYPRVWTLEEERLFQEVGRRLTDSLTSLLAHRALRESERKYRLLVNQIPATVFRGYGDWSVDFFDDKIEVLTGYSREDFNSRRVKWCDLIPAEDFDYAQQKFIEALRTDKSYVREHRLRRKDGELIWVQCRGQIFCDDTGKVNYISGVSFDITDRKRAELAMQESEQKLANIIDFLPDATLVIDKEGQVIAWNRALEEMTGIKSEDMMGKGNYEYALPFYGKRRPMLIDLVLNPGEELAQYTELQKEGLSLSGVAHFPSLRGKEVYLFVKAGILLDSQGNMVGAIESMRDVTDRHKALDERLRFSKLESLGLLAGGIAHDFNNILTAIIGNISLAMLDLKTGDQVYEGLREAEIACQQAQTLSRQLLTFAKGGAPIKKITSLATLINESVMLACRGSQVRCDFRIPDDLWLVEADPGQIGQVLQNLIINAIQAMPAGGNIEIHAANAGSETTGKAPLKPAKYVKVTIQDHGIGIPAEYLPKIFDPYFTTKQSGSGLGLATAYSIIKNHQGKISVESSLGLGTTFSILLPASDQKVVPHLGKDGTLLRGEGKILAMDDEEMVRQVLAKMLTNLGYEAELAQDGAEALERFTEAVNRGEKFAAVILDLTVPGGLGGKETMARLLEIDPQVKALVSSGYSDDPIMAEPQKYGFRGIIAKPYKVVELSQILHEIIVNQSKP
jgi:PAS domain S-box-containing protein